MVGSVWDLDHFLPQACVGKLQLPGTFGAHLCWLRQDKNHDICNSGRSAGSFKPGLPSLSSLSREHARKVSTKKISNNESKPAISIRLIQYFFCHTVSVSYLLY